MNRNKRNFAPFISALSDLQAKATVKGGLDGKGAAAVHRHF